MNVIRTRLFSGLITFINLNKYFKEFLKFPTSNSGQMKKNISAKQTTKFCSVLFMKGDVLPTWNKLLKQFLKPLSTKPLKIPILFFLNHNLSKTSCKKVEQRSHIKSEMSRDITDRLTLTNYFPSHLLSLWSYKWTLPWCKLRLHEVTSSNDKNQWNSLQISLRSRFSFPQQKWDNESEHEKWYNRHIMRTKLLM